MRKRWSIFIIRTTKRLLESRPLRTNGAPWGTDQSGAVITRYNAFRKNKASAGISQSARSDSRNEKTRVGFKDCREKQKIEIEEQNKKKLNW